MANRAYLRVWTRDFSEQTMIAEFARFLATIPLSATHPAFDELTVQAVDSTEAPIAEWDLREGGYGAAEVAALAAQYLNADTAYIVEAKWDLWTLDPQALKWRQGPHPLTLLCHGSVYDEGAAANAGHFAADLGFEYLFTGHADLLTPNAALHPRDGAEHPEEKTFFQWMAAEDNRREYAAKTRENIQQLFNWIEAVERALPVQRSELSSEGEENFEARLDAILAQR